MNRQTLAKIIAVVLLVIALANFIAFIFVKNPPWLFWLVIIVVAVFAYFIIPRIRKAK